MDILKTTFRIDENLICHLPFMFPELEEDTIRKWPSFEERANFISIGNFLHEPNWNSVLFLKEEIWPMIRKELPEAELFVFGAYPSQKVNALHDPKTGFIIKGRADDAETEMKKARVCLAPLRFGAGIKGKLTEAMLCGTPSVTTPIGAEGMHGTLKWNGTIASEPKDIAAAAVKLYTNKSSWQNAQANGIVIINSIYAEKKLRKELDEKLSELEKDLTEHRNANFAGGMLMHHTISGSKYMAKWIEEKNKKR
jgi:glycosyltransferase involved in cell wall biosynthesis